MHSCEALLAQIYVSNDAWQALWQSCYARWNAIYNPHRQKNTSNIVNEDLVILQISMDFLSTLQKDGQQGQVADSEHREQGPVLYRFLDEISDGVITGVYLVPSNTDEEGKDAALDKASGFAYSLAKKANHSILDGDITTPIAKFTTASLRGEYHCMQEVVLELSSSSDSLLPRPAALFDALNTIVEYAVAQGVEILRIVPKRQATEGLPEGFLEMAETSHTPALLVALIYTLLKELTPHTILAIDADTDIGAAFGDYAGTVVGNGIAHEGTVHNLANTEVPIMHCQSALPLLLLHSMLFEDTRYLQQWATVFSHGSVHTADPNSTGRFSGNFMGNSVGRNNSLRLFPSYLPEAELTNLLALAEAKGGQVVYKQGATQPVPLELHINVLSAVAPLELPNSERAKIFLALQSVVLAMQGVPLIDLASLLGLEALHPSHAKTGSDNTNTEQPITNNTSSRQGLNYHAIINSITTEGNLSCEVYRGYMQLLEARTKSRAFHPMAAMEILEVDKSLFSLVRYAANTSPTAMFEKVLCMANLSSNEIVQALPLDLLPWKEGAEDLLTGDIAIAASTKNKAGHGIVELVIEPYEIMWWRFSHNLNLDQDLDPYLSPDIDLGISQDEIQ